MDDRKERSIKILPLNLANQIAAGEVVERPLSVVKELLENSLDAGSDQIEVAVEKGGKRLIRVSDNGYGMDRQDLELSVHPHATSKISTEADLAAISTLGFRGEALASIGSVSRMTITSRRSQDLEGWRIKVDFGHISPPRVAGCRPGTVVEVEDLFERLPARRRFLRQDRTEMAHVAQVVRLLAAAHPEVEFSLLSSGREVFRSVRGAETCERIAPLAGRLHGPFRVLSGTGALKVKGCFSRPEEGVSSLRAFHFFVNRRPVKSRLMWRAVSEALRGRFMKGIYPAGALFLEIDPSQVDVNVHPSKSEVRFADSQSVYRLVYGAVRNALEAEEPLVVSQGPSPGGEEAMIHEEGVMEEVLPWPKDMTRDLSAPFSNQDSPPCRNGQDSSFVHPGPGKPPEALGDAPAAPIRVIGQYNLAYIVVEEGQDLVLVDQHAAHEAIVFKRLTRELDARGGVLSQPLAFPQVLDLSPDEAETLLAVSEELKSIGLELQPFGPGEVALRAVPEFLAASGRGEGADLTGVLSRLALDAGTRPSELIREALASLACHGAIKAGEPLGQAQMESLLDEMDREGVTHCPHGRPLRIRYTISSIMKGFGRVR